MKMNRKMENIFLNCPAKHVNFGTMYEQEDLLNFWWIKAQVAPNTVHNAGLWVQHSFVPRKKFTFILLRYFDQLHPSVCKNRYSIKLQQDLL